MAASSGGHGCRAKARAKPERARWIAATTSRLRASSAESSASSLSIRNRSSLRFCHGWGASLTGRSEHTIRLQVNFGRTPMEDSKPLARGVEIATYRAETDLPFSAEVLTLWLAADGLPRQRPSPDEKAARYELRFKSISAAARKVLRTRVVELAAGLSSRALEFVAEDKLVYVETDRREVVDRKQPIVQALCAKSAPGRVEFALLDLMGANCGSCLESLVEDGAVVLCEGFLNWLEMDDLERALRQIRLGVIQTGSPLITSDLFTKEDAAHSLRYTGGHTFESEDQIIKLTAEWGMACRIERQVDLVPFGALSITARWRMDEHVVRARLAYRRVCVLTPL